MADMVPLGELISIRRGTTYKSALLGRPGPYLLGLGSIARNGGFRSDPLKTYGGESPDSLLVKPGELFASLKDVTQAADLLGSVAQLPHDERPGRLTQDTVRLDLVSERVDRDYLYWLLRTPEYRQFCRSHATGTTNLGLPREDFLGFPVRLPSLDEQRRIAGVLGALDDLIDTNNRSIGSTEALLQAHFDAMSFDSPGGVALVERVELNPSYPKPKGIAPYVDMAALPTDSLFIEEISSRPAAGGARFMRDDVLIARITPCLENGKAAFAGNLLPGEVYVGSTEFIVMRAKQGVPSAWPYFLARSERFREFAIRHMTGSSGRQRLAAASLENYEVGGDADALLEFDRLATTLLDAASQLSAENEQLRRTRDELLPLLMSGAVRVRPEGVAA